MAVYQSAPNFSEGRDAGVLDALRAAARAPGAVLTDFSADPDHNRCVATLLGDADGLREATVRMARVAVERIDLRRHSGAHPFLGALDVLPFIPFRDATMDGADALARSVGRDLADSLGLPVYLYERSASDPSRSPLPILRRGGWPALPERLRAMPPDFGPSAPHPSAGVAVVGARPPLLAFNVDLDSDDLALARRIAARLRESGGGLPGVRALGLRMSSAGHAQVSVNITDPSAATLTAVYRAVRDIAAAEGAAVLRSELIGGISMASVVAALNEAIRGDIRPAQVLDAWLPSPFRPGTDGA